MCITFPWWSCLYRFSLRKQRGVQKKQAKEVFPNLAVKTAKQVRTLPSGSVITNGERNQKQFSNQKGKWKNSTCSTASLTRNTGRLQCRFTVSALIFSAWHTQLFSTITWVGWAQARLLLFNALCPRLFEHFFTLNDCFHNVKIQAFPF